MRYSTTLAEFVVGHEYEALPQDVVHEAKRSILNWIGVAVGAATHSTVDIALSVVKQVGGAPTASILGRAEKTDILHASFVNGTSSHVFDFDDTHLDTIIHPSGPVAAPLFALAERDGLTGRQVLHAFVLGVDAECRIGNAVYPAHYDIGWHITATAGVFGAALASAKALGLNAVQANHAIGLAASQSSGLREMFGTMTKPFHVGNAGKNGLFGALLAQKGFTSSPEGLEGRRAFANVLSAERDLSRVTVDLGTVFELSKNTYKPYACGIVIHPSIDGCIQLRDRLSGAVESVVAIELRVHPLVLELTGKRTPRAGLEGKFSVYHSAAVALIDGEAGEAQYSDARVNDPEVVALRDKVVATADATVREDEAHVTVRTADGTRHHLHVEHALGSLERPMSDGDLERKFHSLARPIIGTERTEEIIELVWRLDELESLEPVIAAACPSRAATA